MRNRDQVHDARQDPRVEPPARAFGDDQVDHGRAVVVEGRQRPCAQRVPVLAVDALGEVHVAPASRDVAEQGVLPHPLAVTDARNDVPVAVRAAAAGDDPDVLAALAVHLAARDRVDGRPVRRGDIDAEVERLAALRADPRIAEEPANRVLLVERLHWPAVAHLDDNIGGALFAQALYPQTVARVTIDAATGALVTGGRKLFPIALSNPPPADRARPGGGNGLAAVAAAGVNIVRTGIAGWSSEFADGQIAQERAKLDAAATHGLLCWLWLGDLPDLPAGQPARASASSLLVKVVNALKGHPALGLWKSVDEPRNSLPGRQLDPAGRAHPRLPAHQGARPEPSGRDHARARQPGHPADALPPRVRHHRCRHLPGLVSTRQPQRHGEQGSQRGRRRDEDAAERLPARSPSG